MLRVRLKYDDLSLSLFVFLLIEGYHWTAITVPLEKLPMSFTLHFRKPVPNFSKKQVAKVRSLCLCTE